MVITNQPKKSQEIYFAEVGSQGWPLWPWWQRAKGHTSVGARSRSSAAMCWASRGPSPQRLHCVLVHRPRVSVYSQGMATMATMATPN